MKSAIYKKNINILQSPYEILDIDCNIPKSEIMNAFQEAIKLGKDVHKISKARSLIANPFERIIVDLFYYPEAENGSSNKVMDSNLSSEQFIKNKWDLNYIHQCAKDSFQQAINVISTEDEMEKWKSCFHNSIAYYVALSMIPEYLKGFAKQRIKIYGEELQIPSGKILADALIKYLRKIFANLRDHLQKDNTQAVLVAEWLDLALETECASAQVYRKIQKDNRIMGWRLSCLLKMDNRIQDILHTRSLASRENSTFLERELFGPYALIAFCIINKRFRKAYELLREKESCSKGDKSFKVLFGIAQAEFALAKSSNEEIKETLADWKNGLKCLHHTPYEQYYKGAFIDIVKKQLRLQNFRDQDIPAELSELIETAIGIVNNDEELIESYVLFINQVAISFFSNNDLAMSYKWYKHIFQFQDACQKIKDNILHVGITFALLRYESNDIETADDIAHSCLKLFPDNFFLLYISKYKRRPDVAEYAAYIIKKGRLFDRLNNEELSKIRKYERQGVRDIQLFNSIILTQKKLYFLAKEALKMLKPYEDRSELEDEVFEEVMEEIKSGLESSEYFSIEYQMDCIDAVKDF